MTQNKMITIKNIIVIIIIINALIVTVIFIIRQF